MAIVRVSKKQMVTWFKTYRENIPIENPRLAPYIVDFNCEQDLTEDIFDDPLFWAIDAVNKIIQTYPPPYNVFVSGGVDSQAMLWAWHSSGHKFTVCHFDYGNDLNYHDRKYLEKFIKRNRLETAFELKIIPFDAVSFMQGPELAKLAKEYDTVSPQILTYIKMSQQVPGTVIFAGNFIDASKNASLNYTILGLKRFYEANPNKIVPFFFIHTPQLAYSFYKSSRTMHIDERYYSDKVELYNTHGFPVVAQPNKKTGFEKIKLLFDHIEISAKMRLRWGNQKSYRPFDYLFRYSNYDHIGIYNDKVNLIHHRLINKLRNA